MQEKHPELFDDTMDVDPRKRKRILPLKVLSLGMPRTGTACTVSPLYNIQDFRVANSASSNAAGSKHPRLSMLPWSYPYCQCAGHRDVE